jgi:hypothetical protein
MDSIGFLGEKIAKYQRRCRIDFAGLPSISRGTDSHPNSDRE